MERQKHGFDMLYREIPDANYSYSIKTANDKHIFTMRYQTAGFSYQRYVVLNMLKTKIFIGTVEYKKQDEDRVTNHEQVYHQS